MRNVYFVWAIFILSIYISFGSFKQVPFNPPVQINKKVRFSAGRSSYLMFLFVIVVPSEIIKKLKT